MLFNFNRKMIIMVMKRKILKIINSGTKLARPKGDKRTFLLNSNRLSYLQQILWFFMFREQMSAVAVVYLPSHVQLFGTLWIAACQASLSFTVSQSLLKLVSIASVIRSNQLIPWFPLLLWPSIFPSIKVFFNESDLHIRWPKYRNFSCV